ncbi:MAG: lipocalin-like domain-containing protein [Desulfobaccales bacterium]
MELKSAFLGGFLGILMPAFFLSGGLSAAEAPDFKPARPDRVFQFPQDHGAHPDFKTEWWYYTGHLETQAGENFGYQLTFFRVGLRKSDPQARSRWRADTVYFAHLAVSDPNRGNFIFRERAQRGALGLAGAAEGRLKVWIDDWLLEGRGEGHHLRAKQDGIGLELDLLPSKPIVLHGEGGYSRKSATAEVASHYYSITRLATRGKLTLNGRILEVSGTSWFDREFSTSQLTPDQVGWDWFALQLSDGTDLMLYVMRLKDGRLDPASAGTIVDLQGQSRPLGLADFQITPTGTWKSPHSGATYPSGWQITLPQEGYRLSLQPTLADQELRTGGRGGISYWEGQVRVHGAKNDKPLNGMGYVELTGYAGSLGGRF